VTGSLLATVGLFSSPIAGQTDVDCPANSCLKNNSSGPIAKAARSTAAQRLTHEAKDGIVPNPHTCLPTRPDAREPLACDRLALASWRVQTQSRRGERQDDDWTRQATRVWDYVGFLHGTATVAALAAGSGRE